MKTLQMNRSIFAVGDYKIGVSKSFNSIDFTTNSDFNHSLFSILLYYAYERGSDFHKINSISQVGKNTKFDSKVYKFISTTSDSSKTLFSDTYYDVFFLNSAMNHLISDLSEKYITFLQRKDGEKTDCQTIPSFNLMIKYGLEKTFSLQEDSNEIIDINDEDFSYSNIDSKEYGFVGKIHSCPRRVLLVRDVDKDNISQLKKDLSRIKREDCTVDFQPLGGNSGLVCRLYPEFFNPSRDFVHSNVQYQRVDDILGDLQKPIIAENLEDRVSFEIKQASLF